MKDLVLGHANHCRPLDATFEPFIFDSYLISDMEHYRFITYHSLDISIPYARNGLESRYAIDAPYGEEDFRTSVEETRLLLGGI